MALKIAVFFGGKSVEHEVSVESAKNIIGSLVKKYEIYPIFVDKDGRWSLVDKDISSGLRVRDRVWYDFSDGFFVFGEEKVRIDLCFSVIHGNIGEDGKLQGFFETVGVAYTGCDVLASAISMNKSLAKRMVREVGVRVLEDVVVKKEEYDFNSIVEKVKEIGFPVFVKPNSLGSSVGVSKAKTIDELKITIEKAFDYDEMILIERGIEKAREIVVGIIGDGKENITSACGEVCVKGKHEFYDYEAKYIDEDAVELKIPAVISKELADFIKKEAQKVFWAVGGYGFSRVDFLMDPRDNDVFFCEINTIPGFTSHSLFPRLFEYSGIALERQLDMIIDLALKRHERKRLFRLTR